MRPAVPGPESFPYLETFSNLFKEAGYTFSRLQELFPDTTLTGRDVSRLEEYRQSVERSEHRAHRLARLWLLREPLERPLWNQLMGSEMVVQGLSHGLINGSALTHLEACFDLHPAQNALILTDPKFRHQWEEDQQGVYYLGSDSYGLIHALPRDSVGSVLDLFTGSGVHAVLAVSHAEEVTGVDINPRAVALATANAALNGCGDRCQFVQGDLYQPVEGRTFDLITANPPFVPTPDQDLALYRSGGESGEFLTARVLARLHEFLNPGGRLAMVTNYPVFEDVDIVDHHRSLLGCPDQFGIALLHSYTFPNEMYVGMHLAPTGDLEKDRQARLRWLESYRKNRIAGVGFGVLFFENLESGHPWSAREDGVDLVHRPLGEQVSQWLRQAASRH